MMIGNSRKGYQGKEEGDGSTTHHQQHIISNSIEKLYSKIGSSSSSSRQWSGLRNPRIVRVSRSFGGKDRHSKVCTIRGLRDRRIRLSVPTAIQLYELQDKLGLNQPSKVIDWLIEATKHDIDMLPPLPIPLGFPQFHHHQTLLPDHESSSSSHHQPPSHQFGAFFDANNSSSFMESVSRLKGKEVDERGGCVWDKGKWVMKANNEEDGIGGSAQNLFPSGSSSSHSCLPMTYYGNSFQSETSNFLSLFGSHGLFPNTNNNPQVDPGHNSVQLPSSSSVSPLLFCPSTSATTPSLFAPYYAPYSSVPLENDPRVQQLNHIELISSSNSHYHHPLILPSFKPVMPAPPFSSRLLDSNDKDNAPS